MQKEMVKINFTYSTIYIYPSYHTHRLVGRDSSVGTFGSFHTVVLLSLISIMTVKHNIVVFDGHNRYQSVQLLVTGWKVLGSSLRDGDIF